ncbi:MAG TPA: fused response regulator/phosphatase [Acidimicrobiales bacterium]|nr:fused response regulator/phosphatase [Acidimicrobiales bacterium]
MNTPSTTETRILLIEDDGGDAYLVQDHMAESEESYSVVWVRTLAAAADIIHQPFDCVLLDLGLPDAQGLDGLQSLLRLQPDLAIIVLTGLDDQHSGARALELGAQDYLPKGSVDREVLVRSLRYAMARRGNEEATRKLREAELSRAENARLERGLLAQPILRNPRLQWATRYQPGGRRALLGGDFFDAIELVDGTIRLVVGDVCGHGPDEAALGVALRVAWRSLVLADQPPDVSIPALQRVLEAERPNEEIFATLCDIEISGDLQSVRMRLAGHPSPLLLTGDEVRELPVESRGPLLGVFDDPKWPMNAVELGESWTMVVFTDGIVEGRAGPGHDRFETTGLARLTLQSTSETTDLETLADLLITGAEAANGEPLCDDVALLLLSTSDHWDR